MKEKTVYKNHLIVIEEDDNPDNPRNWDNLGTMVCFHRNYNLGDDDHGYNSGNYSSWDELKADIIQDEGPCIMLPLYLYEHGGITMSTGAFSCPWDSGMVGLIYVSLANVRKEYSAKRVSKKLQGRVAGYLKGEVETYDQFLTGDVYGYSIYAPLDDSFDDETDQEDEDLRDDLDSCWGFFGYDTCLTEAKTVVDYYEREKTTA
jgi:hypothetical protein